MVVVLLLKIAILKNFGAKNRTDPGGTDVRDFTNVPPSTKLPLAAPPAFGPFHVPPAGSRFRPPLFPVWYQHTCRGEGGPQNGYTGGRPHGMVFPPDPKEYRTNHA